MQTKNVFWLGVVVAMLVTTFKGKNKVKEMRSAIAAELTEKNFPDEEILKILKGIDEKINTKEATVEEFIDVIVSVAIDIKQSVVDKTNELFTILDGIAKDSRNTLASILNALAKEVATKK